MRTNKKTLAEAQPAKQGDGSATFHKVKPQNRP